MYRRILPAVLAKGILPYVTQNAVVLEIGPGRGSWTRALLKSSIEEILRVLPKMKLGGRALHQYADGEKLDAYGWRKGNVPTTFRDKPDDEIW